jgi:hypothetical protein
MKTIIAFLGLVALFTTANAQGLPTIADVKVVTDGVMNKVAKETLRAALNPSRN